MKTGRALAILAAGIALGAGGAWALLAGGSSSSAASSASTAMSSAGAGSSSAEDGLGGGATTGAKAGAKAGATGAAAEASALRLELVREREALGRARSVVSILERDLGLARQQLALVSRSPGAAGAASAGASRPAGVVSQLDPAHTAERLRALEPEVHDALAKRNGKRALALFRELAALGKPAWPLVARLGTSMAQAMEEGDGGGLGVSGIEYLKTLATPELRELYAQALEAPQANDPAFRRLAVWGITIGDPDGAVPALLRGLAAEPDDSIAQMMAGMLAQSHDPAHVPALARALAAPRSPQIRQALVLAIAEVAGPDATRALADVAAGEPDEQVKRVAASCLKVREASVPGYLVTDIAPTSAAFAAGLREGDVVTSYRGSPIANAKQLGAAMVGLGPEEQVALEVSRAGQTVRVALKGGQLWASGAAGRFTRPGLR